MNLDNGLQIKDVSKSERVNNYSINVFDPDEKTLYPNNFLPKHKSEKNCFLKKSFRFLFKRNRLCLIKMLYTFTGTQNRRNFCANCFTTFSNEDVLKNPGFMPKKQRCIMKVPREDVSAFGYFFQKMRTNFLG